MLVHFAALVKPGGRLIYATCSVLSREGAEQIDWFLKKRPDFQVVPIQDVWSKVIAPACPLDGNYLNLSPAANGTDGFFAAVLELSPANGNFND